MKEEKKKVSNLGSSMRRREERGYKKEGRSDAKESTAVGRVVGGRGRRRRRRPTGEQDADEREGRTSRS